ncbi:MAG: DUF3168 domain-containing protein [Roseivirga sp.]|nr:DUF3168 domain-containing protein [Roseivirga sp.]
MSVGITSKILKGDTAVNSSVGGRIYSLLAARGTPKPYIVLYSDGGDPVSTMHEKTTTAYNSIIVACYGSNLTLVKSIAEKVRQALEHYKGTIDGEEVTWISWQGPNPEDYDEDLKLAVYEDNYRLTVRL